MWFVHIVPALSLTLPLVTLRSGQFRWQLTQSSCFWVKFDVKETGSFVRCSVNMTNWKPCFVRKGSELFIQDRAHLSCHLTAPQRELTLPWPYWYQTNLETLYSFGWGNWNLEKLSDLFKVLGLIKGKLNRSQRGSPILSLFWGVFAGGLLGFFA